MSLPPMKPGQIWFDKPTDTSFQDEGKFFFLTNFEENYPFSTPYLPTEIDNQGKITSTSNFIYPRRGSQFNWKTSEHLFHALKFTQDGGKLDLIEGVEDQTGPLQALSFAGGHNGDYEVKNWWFGGNYGIPGYNVKAMRWVVREKFKNPILRQKLLDTMGKKLVENTSIRRKNDEFWGNGHSKNGQNWLGKILEDIRTELKTSDGTPPTPSSTPPFTPPPSPTPNGKRKLDNTEIHVFEAKIETELSNKGIATSDLSPQYQKWLNYIGTKEWKAGELDNYENDLKKEIERVANKKKQPNTPPASTPPPKANQSYRDKWVQYLEKEFKELDFGDKHDDIAKKLSVTKDKIKSNQLDTELEVEKSATKFLDILKKLGKGKSTPSPINSPNSPSSPPNSQNPSGSSVPKNEKPTELTPEEESSLLNQLDNLNKETPEDSEKEKEEELVEISVIKKYFQANNNIKSIILEDNGELTIEFQGKTTLTTLANDKQLQQIKKYLQQNKEKSLNREKLLNISQNSHPDKVNYLNRPLVGGGLAILVIFFALIIFRQRKIRKGKWRTQGN